MCRETKNARIYLAPPYAPSIYRVLLQDDGTFRVTDIITLKDREGRPLNGLPNPLQNATTEIPFDGRGKASRTGRPRHRRRSAGPAHRRYVLDCR